jgi:hypothetical protein
MDENGSSIQGRLQDGAKIEGFKYLSKGKIFPVPTLSLSPLCPRTSKRLSMGGGGRYNAILEFKGEQIKNEKEK